jgi:hypothetical protein
VETFKNSASANLDEKLAAVFGLYLPAPERLLPFRFDAKAQV